MYQILLIVGASVLGVLGVVHIVYTVFTDKFSVYDLSVLNGMKSTSPKITKETTVWDAWVGFNVSHSLGLILFAFMYIPLALNHVDFIKASVWFSSIPAVFSVGYLFLAYRYWFRVPLIGVSMSLICFIGAQSTLYI
ncbi:LIC_13387 family protein [Rheinheimera pleomorphica]|uniref:LIC_13387 family protein n=1 Tax=Rheinheimera pleomorphica TaxID=2703963 RepID=UPI0014245033|nr:hypothetical protein [Rheinheimera pleomorphica]